MPCSPEGIRLSSRNNPENISFALAESLERLGRDIFAAAWKRDFQPNNIPEAVQDRPVRDVRLTFEDTAPSFDNTSLATLRLQIGRPISTKYARWAERPEEVEVRNLITSGIGRVSCKEFIPDLLPQGVIVPTFAVRKKESRNGWPRQVSTIDTYLSMGRLRQAKHLADTAIIYALSADYGRQGRLRHRWSLASAPQES